MPESVVSIKNIRKIYKQGLIEVAALQDVSLEIEKGAFLALAGPSGSGKTTLLNLIGGLDRPTSGEIKVAGEDLNKLSLSKLSRLRLKRIGFVFQAYNLIPVLTALENSEFTLLLQGISQDIRRKKVETLFKEIGLDGLEDRYPRELSGGQQQRVAVARAIVSEPSIILADEPTANLDISRQVEILDLIKSLCLENGLAVMAALHDLNLAAQYCDRLVLLNRGRVHAEGTPREVITTRNIKEVYGAENCVYPHPLNGLPAVLLSAGNDKSAMAGRDVV